MQLANHQYLLVNQNLICLDFIQQENGFRKEEMVMIGDNYDTDILAGIRFGIDTIHVEGRRYIKGREFNEKRTATNVFISNTYWNGTYKKAFRYHGKLNAGKP